MKFPLVFREVYVASRVDPETRQETYDSLALGVRQQIAWHPQLQKFWRAISWLYPFADPGGHPGDILFGNIIRNENGEVDIEYALSDYPEGKRPIRRLRPLTLQFWNQGVKLGRIGFRQRFDSIARLKAHLWDEALDGEDWWQEFPPPPPNYKPSDEVGG